MKSVQKGLQLLIVSSSVGFLGPQLFAQDSQTNLTDHTKITLDDRFNRGLREASVGGGFMMTCITGEGRPIVNYAMGYVNVGYFFYDPAGSGFFRGNLEVLPEVFGAGIYESPTAGGNYIAGATLYLRYNFIQKNWWCVPYLQGGAGLTSMDINHGYDGMNFNFNLDAGAGARFLVARNWSINAEVLFQHISNADTADHNIGLNSIGPRLSASFSF